MIVSPAHFTRILFVSFAEIMVIGPRNVIP